MYFVFVNLRFLGMVLSTEAILGTQYLWPYLFAVPVPAVLLHIAFTPLVRKSPKRLFIDDATTDEAIKSIRFYHGETADVSEILQVKHLSQNTNFFHTLYIGVY